VVTGSRLLKNARLPFDRLTALSFAEGLRCAHHSLLRRTEKYASFLMIACKQVSQTAHALHPSIFEQSAQNDFFNNLLAE